ncbi:hypothetical protein D3C80_1727770 [compost metagenome]
MSSTKGMTRAPATTPTSRAVCWRQGVASTNWPVLRSCRLSLAITATAKTTAVTIRAKATTDGSAGTPAMASTPSISSEAMMMARMPTPDTGLFDEPISPAM